MYSAYQLDYSAFIAVHLCSLILYQIILMLCFCFAMLLVTVSPSITQPFLVSHTVGHIQSHSVSVPSHSVTFSFSTVTFSHIQSRSYFSYRSHSVTFSHIQFQYRHIQSHYVQSCSPLVTCHYAGSDMIRDNVAGKVLQECVDGRDETMYL